jgi:phosphohistidine phosphatase SixA
MTSQRFERRRWAKRSLAVLILLVLCPSAQAQELSGAALVEALRGGGFNIYFRHTATSWDQEDHVGAAGDWRSCDPVRMRQLSAEGRDMAKRIGAAIDALRIPVAKVMSSEYCRAVETAQLLDLGPVTQTSNIVNLRSASYAGGNEAAVRRARTVLSQPPPAGANAVIVGHGNLMSAATGVTAEEGGSAVYAPAPGSDLGFDIVARLDAEDWEKLAAALAAE